MLGSSYRLPLWLPISQSLVYLRIWCLVIGSLSMTLCRSVSSFFLKVWQRSQQQIGAAQFFPMRWLRGFCRPLLFSGTWHFSVDLPVEPFRRLPLQTKVRCWSLELFERLLWWSLIWTPQPAVPVQDGGLDSFPLPIRSRSSDPSFTGFATMPLLSGFVLTICQAWTPPLMVTFLWVVCDLLITNRTSGSTPTPPELVYFFFLFTSTASSTVFNFGWVPEI